VRYLYAMFTVCSIALWAGPAPALTVHYQPTPATESFVDQFYPPATSPTENLQASHVWEGWVSSNANKTFQRNDALVIGGRKGDQYRAFAKFDLTGLPAQVEAAELGLRSYVSHGTATVDFAVCLLTTPWTPTFSWKKQPKYGPCTSWYPAPVAGMWSEVSITDWYNAWQSNPSSNNGIVLLPRSVKGQFDTFRSTRYSAYESDPEADASRPVLALTYSPPAGMPDFKLPLPPGWWLLSNEIGGYECMDQLPYWPDDAHQGNSYFSLDFVPIGETEDGTPYVGDIPVFAAADGTIVENSYTSGNGYFVTINHSGSSSPIEGYTTKYLHLAVQSPLPVEKRVLQGQQIGVLGNSGDYTTGPHLHFGVYFNGQGDSTQANLTYVVLDGLLMKSYQTECAYDSAGKPIRWIRSYQSTNEPCGILCGGFGEY
jgi:Peptidase family M23